MALSGYPDGQPRGYSNQFATSLTGSTSTGTLLQDFGFGAGLLKMVVDSGGPVYITMNSTVGSTGGYRLTSGDLLTDWYNIGVPQSFVALCQGTSTALAMRVGAWG